MKDTEPPLDEISTALLGVEYLVHAVDYAMSLHIDYERQPDDAPVSLVDVPERERSNAIEDYLAAHREELAVNWLKCPLCGREEVDRRQTQCLICGDNLQPVLEEDEERLRGLAWDSLIWSTPGAWARYIVPNWLLQKLIPGQMASAGEYKLPRRAVLTRLAKFARNVRQTYIGNIWQYLHTREPEQLLPCGASVQERHRDYLVTREKLIAAYNWLTGIAHQCPEFMEDDEQHKGIRRFAPALPTPPIEPAVRYLFRKVGANFRVRFDGEMGDIPTSLRGSEYVFALLQRPNTAMRAVELRGGVETSERNDKHDRAEQASAIEMYKETAVEIHDEILEARESRDQPRVERLQKDLERIAAEVASLKGLGGRTRSRERSSDSPRVSVYQSLQILFKNCRQKYNLPRLATHLNRLS
jgi:hypothetical protein